GGAAWREPSPRPNSSGGPPLPTVAEAVGAVLAGLGVRDVFGLVGSGNFVVTNSLVAAGAAFIASRHEGGAVAMADAYARVSGRLGVCSVHQGPGLTNTITGLTEAAKSRTPLLVLAGDTAAAGGLGGRRGGGPPGRSRAPADPRRTRRGAGGGWRSARAGG